MEGGKKSKTTYWGLVDLELAIADKCYPNPEDRTGGLQVEHRWGKPNHQSKYNT